MPREVACRGVAAAVAVAIGLIASAASAADGEAVFKSVCAACHQADGTGVIGLAPPLRGAHWKKLAAQRDYVLRVVAHGLSGPITIDGQRYLSAMPAQVQLADDDLAAAATYLVGTLGADTAPAGFQPYDAAEVAAARAAKLGPADQGALRKQLLK